MAENTKTSEIERQSNANRTLCRFPVIRSACYTSTIFYVVASDGMKEKWGETNVREGRDTVWHQDSKLGNFRSKGQLFSPTEHFVHSFVTPLRKKAKEIQAKEKYILVSLLHSLCLSLHHLCPNLRTGRS
jgi:hypothetical protein